MTKETTKAPKAKKVTFREELLKSSIGNRLSISTLEVFLNIYSTKEEVLLAVIKQLTSIFTIIELEEFKQITSDLNKLIDLK